MADPVLPTVIRTLCVLQNADELPEDRYITTLAFARGGGSFEDSAVRIGELVSDFWNSGAGGTATPLSLWVGPQVSRSIDACSVLSYDLGQSIPRTPHVTRFTMGPGQTDNAYLGPIPAECAACLTLTTALRTQRGRGRLYLGPFNKYSLGATEAGDATVSSTLRSAMRAAATHLMTDAQAGSPALGWSVISHADATWREITGGWVDDAFDTQRRRGRHPVIRELWPLP